MPDCVILNPHAGSADTIESLADRLSGMGLQICRSESSEEAADIAEKAAKDGSERVFSAGGDGSANAIVNGLMRVPDRRTALGILPAGTGNDFARSLGVELDVSEAIDQIGQLRPRLADVLRCTLDGAVVHALNVVIAGFSGQMHAIVTDELKKRWGPLAYLRAGAEAAADARTYQMDLTIEPQLGKIHRASAELHNLIIANGRYAGGGFTAAPHADPFDGTLNIAAVRASETTLEFAGLAARIAGGQLGSDYTNSPLVSQWEVQRLTIKSDPTVPITLDGNAYEATDLIVELLPAELAVLVPTKTGVE